MGGKKSSISSNTAIVMGTIALSIDLAQVFLHIILIGFFLNPLIDIFALVGFWIAFYFMGVNFTATRALVFFGLGFLEMFPGVGAFPLWTIDIIAVILLTNMQARLGKSGEEIVSDPRTRTILKRGIMRASNKRISNRPGLQEKIIEKGGNRWESESERLKVGTSVPIANPNRDAKIAAQRQQKQSNEKEQQMVS